jgi:hypothetical protein
MGHCIHGNVHLRPRVNPALSWISMAEKRDGKLSDHICLTVEMSLFLLIADDYCNNNGNVAHNSKSTNR